MSRRFTAIADHRYAAAAAGRALAAAYPAARMHAARAAGADGGARRSFGDVELLPFAPNAFDLAVSALALQDVNDLPGTLVANPPNLEAGRTVSRLPHRRRRACANCATRWPKPRTKYPAASRRASRLSPICATWAACLQRAGFALPVTDVETLTVRYPHLFALLADLRAMGATNTLVERLRQPARRALFLRAAEIYARDNADADGRLRATFEIVFLSGWAPHESQQKPLKPGSGQISLAEVLRKS